MDFAILVNHRVKRKENEKRCEYFDICQKTKKIIKVMVIPIVLGALGAILKTLIGYKRNSKLEEEPRSSVL